MSILTEPLPSEGLRCIEASAGSGKTQLLSTLAARWLVDPHGIEVDDLVVVTFTVAAARELRARVRDRLGAVRASLAVEPPGDVRALDEDLAWCTTAGPREVLLERAERALAGFDAVTISTIHAFAQSALGARDLLVATGVRRRQAIADVLTVAAYDEHSTLFDAKRRPQKSLDDAVRIALDNPDAQLVPDASATAPPVVHEYAHVVREAVERFQRFGRRDGVGTYADLLTELDAAVAEDDAPLLATLRARHKVALVDEFQDTDPLQWRILRRIFLESPGHALVVVGDPKQAIYGFRGADVDTYLEARNLAMASPAGLDDHSLTTNYRSDARMLRVLNALFDGAALDEEGEIRYRVVTSPPDAGDAHLEVFGQRSASLSLRLYPTERPAAVQQRAIAEECAIEARELLDFGAIVDGTHRRAVGELDLVVLSESKGHFASLREAFWRQGIRTTEAKTDDVLLSPAALDVEIALRAMSDPLHAGAVGAVAHSWLGAGLEGTDGVGGVRRCIARWIDALEERGVAALGRLLMDPASTPGLLEAPDGERLVTDVQHLFDVLAANVPASCGATQLLETLRELRATEHPGGEDDLRTRRIDTDAPAVRLMTMHSAKGLEFPIVLCPFIQCVRAPSPPTLWRDGAGRLLDVGGGPDWTDERLDAPSSAERASSAARSKAGENRRCLYVALTRPQHRLVVWWERRRSAAERQRDELTALLLDRDDAGRLVQRPLAERSGAVAPCFDATGVEALATLGDHFAPLVGDGLVELHAVGDPRYHATTPADAPTGTAGEQLGLALLGVSRLDRDLSPRPQRCSFSSLVAASHDEAGLDESLGDAHADDEAPDEVPDEDPDEDVGGADEARPEASAQPDALDPFGGLRGTSFGSAIHEALDLVLSRPAGQAFDEVAAPSLAHSLRRWGVDPQPEVLDGLLRASSTPIAGGPSLRDLGPEDVATEVHFELPVAAGVGLRDVASTLLDRGDAGPFTDWASELATGQKVPLAATLVGSIDLVTTLGTSRYSVIDYKTNVCEPWGYATTDLHGAMRVADYPLQALLYLVALHRLLRWRLDGYDASQHLGGAHYLFLRGMRPGSSDGIVSWSPGAHGVAAVSDLLAGRS
jgi:exodeoxyribonuclease V beta subunit